METPSSVDRSTNLTQLTRTLQIIVFALIAGVMSMGIILFVVRGNKPPAAQPPLPSLIVIPFAAGGLLAAVFVPRIMAANARKLIAARWPASGRPTSQQIDTFHGELAALYQTLTIIQGALIEGPAFFSLIVYFLGGEIWLLALVVVLLLLLGTRIPTVDRISSWIDAQLDEISISGQLG